MGGKLQFLDTISGARRRAKGARAGLHIIPVLLLCAFLAALPVSVARALDPAFLTLGAGSFDMNGDESTGTVSVEYTGGKRLFWEFKPMGGLMATFDGAFYLYGGVAVDIFLGKRLVLTPSFAPGYYHKGSGLDLGHKLEFRSQLEIAYRFDNRARLGFAISHMSNASIGDINPGTESAMIYYSIPLGK